MSDFLERVYTMFDTIADFFRQAVGFVDNMHDTAADSYTVLTDGLSILPDFAVATFVACIAVAIIYLILGR